MKKEDIQARIEKTLKKNPKISDIDLAKECKVPVILVRIFRRKVE
jgi:hypothetical protein